MRQTLIIASISLLAACGPAGDRPWDENRDGLITACEGLNAFTCAATPGCEQVPVFCTMECRSDGHGGCLPCRPEGRCQRVPRPPPLACEELSAEACLAQPGCGLEAATGSSTCDGTGPCPRCLAPAQRCVTLPPPRPPVDDCAGRDPTLCSSDGRCALLAEACPAVCLPEPNGGCAPCTPAERCVPVSPPSPCAGLDRESCLAAGCGLVELDVDCPASDAACTTHFCTTPPLDGGSAPPQP